MDSLDRRNSVYTVFTLDALVARYICFFSDQRIHDIYREVKEGFIIRTGSAEEETKLQILSCADSKLTDLLLTRNLQ